jgi:hypothetical protein
MLTIPGCAYNTETQILHALFETESLCMSLMVPMPMSVPVPDFTPVPMFRNMLHVDNDLPLPIRVHGPSRTGIVNVRGTNVPTLGVVLLIVVVTSAVIRHQGSRVLVPSCYLLRCVREVRSVSLRVRRLISLETSVLSMRGPIVVGISVAFLLGPCQPINQIVRGLIRHVREESPGVVARLTKGPENRLPEGRQKIKGLFMIYIWMIF